METVRVTHTLEIDGTTVEVGPTYRHFNGGTYVVRGHCVIEAFAANAVLYSNDNGGPLWARPISSWSEVVQWPDGVMRPRFCLEHLLMEGKAPEVPVTKRRLWVEGYRVTGSSGGAEFLGEFAGGTFWDAVAAYNASRTDRERTENPLTYDKHGNPSLWGRRIFDNETEARKSFG